MIPIKTDIQLKGIPLVTIVCIISCTLTFFLRSPRLFPGGVVPLDFVYSFLHPDESLISSVILLISSLFLHGSPMHLLGNMWYLWLFGSGLEKRIGSFRFVFFYFLSGFAAMITQVANNPLSTIPIIGASGAIAGIMGMYLVVLPFSKIILGIPPFFILRLPAVLFLLFWFWLQWSNVGSTYASANKIAWWAHIGGFCFGILSGLYVRFLSPIRTRNYRAASKNHR